MINTAGLLLQPHTEFELSNQANIDDIVQNWRYLRKQPDYFPQMELLSDGKLKIEFSPSKVWCGQNLYEIAPSDMPQVLVRLNTLLSKAHVLTCPAILLYAHTYRMDYAKVCYVPFSSQTLWSCLQEQHRGGHYKQAFTFYAEDGHMAAGSLKRRKVCFYNKTAEILQDKRNTDELKDKIRNLPGTFYRFECSLKTAKEIKRELKVCGVSVESCCLKDLSQENVVRAVLQKNLEKTVQHWHVPDKAKALDKVRMWLDQKEYENTRSLLTDMLHVMSCVYVGVEDVRQIIEKKLGKRRAREFIQRFEKLQLEDVHCLAVFKETFMKAVQELNPLSNTDLDELTRKEIVTESDTCLFAPVLLAIVELFISTPLG